ncbi:MAG TPA: ABC transporter ATP-binding protein [Gemmatales bacterium]|nr:ABC transporter ATP-binding protein [Gemmatales bacterium]
MPSSPSSLPGPPHAAAPPPLLHFDRVSKWYGGVIGLNELSLVLPPGITGLVGPNGAGKSTLMKLATGQLRPDLGQVRIYGHDAWSAAAKRHLGYCPDVDRFFEEMSGRQFVRAMALLCGLSRAEARDRTEWALEQTGMADRSERRLRGYSKGMRQRIKLAQALLHDPDLIILDEPMNGVDPVGRIELQELFLQLAAGGKSLLVSSHQLEELEKLTEHIVVLARGLKVAEGTIAAIRDLMNDQPLAIRIDCDQPRHLAAALLRLSDVLGVELEGERVVARARQPQRFFRELADLVLHEGLNLQHLETLDCSAQAILDYVLKGRR